MVDCLLGTKNFRNSHTNFHAGRIRKVKCDETKPHCRRCISTDRTCDGYPVAPIGQAAYSWHDLVVAVAAQQQQVPRRMPSSFHTADQLEVRALDFFRLQVGPVLSMHSSAHFWQTLVLQLAHREPAVRHALACIGSTYEGLDDDDDDGNGGAASTLPGPWRQSRERFALAQYTLALRHVSAPGADRNMVLVVCLLFICIESMRENKVLAIQHCRHGIAISNETTMTTTTTAPLDGWARELRPIFLRVATLPYLFGEAADFPQPTAFLPSTPLATCLRDASEEARSMAWDALINRAIRLVRLGVMNRRENERDQPVPQDLVDEQGEILRLVAPWDQYFQQLRSAAKNKRQPDTETFLRNVQFEIQCVIVKVWTASCLESNEMRYDHFMPDFERILSLTQQVIARQATTTMTRTTATPHKRPKFIFEMGFMPLLYFVILSCRRLDLRLIALRHALLLGAGREHLFNTKTLYAVGTRVVELEHGVRLDPARPACEGAPTAPLPADEVRIRSADITEDVEVRTDGTGRTAEYRMVWFLVRPGAVVPGFIEWIKVGPHASSLTSLPAMSRWSSVGRDKYSA